MHLVNFFFNLFSSSWSPICKGLKYLIQYLLFIVVLNAHGVFLFSETLSFLWCSLCVVLFCVQICSYSVKYCHVYTKVFYSLTKGLIFSVVAGVVLILQHSFHPWFTNFPRFCCMIMYGLSLQHDLRIIYEHFVASTIFWKITWSNLCCLSCHFLLLIRTERDWDNSLIIKRVLFEVFDCFLPLFYIAFYQLNVVALRRELVGLFWGMCS